MAFTCPFCNKELKTIKKRFQDHISSVHFNQKNYNCDICGKAFQNVGNLKMHKRKVHEKNWSDKCGQCDKLFRSK